MSKKLTKQDLITWGIKITADPTEECGYLVVRYGRNNSSQTKSYKRITVYKNGQYHPYSNKVKYYYIFAFSYNGKSITLPLARALYAYFIGDVPQGYDIDHINNDSLDNSLNNLQLLTRKENIAKRKGYKNQYEAKKYETSPEMREAFEKLLIEGE